MRCGVVGDACRTATRYTGRRLHQRKPNTAAAPAPTAARTIAATEVELPPECGSGAAATPLLAAAATDSGELPAEGTVDTEVGELEGRPCAGFREALP